MMNSHNLRGSINITVVESLNKNNSWRTNSYVDYSYLFIGKIEDVSMFYKNRFKEQVYLRKAIEIQIQHAPNGYKDRIAFLNYYDAFEKNKKHRSKLFIKYKINYVEYNTI